MEKEKSSKRTREGRDHSRHKDGNLTRNPDDERRLGSDRRHRRSYKDSSNREHKSSRKYERERSYDSRDDREGSRDIDTDFEGEVKRERSNEPRKERERSRHRDVRRERSVDRHADRDSDNEYRSEREESADREPGRRHNKRKVREESEDRGDKDDKRVRVLEDRIQFNDGKASTRIKERKKFDDGVKKEDGDGEGNGKQLNDVKVREGVIDGGDIDVQGVGNPNGSCSIGNVVGLKSPAMFGRTVPETFSPGHPRSSKVSSIYTTNENKGVSVTRSHEVPGKSSTDGSSSTAGKSGSLSLDALAKAKKALQKQKELAEKIKKIPQLNKSTTSVFNLSSPTVSKEDGKVAPAPLPISSTLSGTVAAANVSSTSAANSTSLPVPTVSDVVRLASGPALEAVRKAQDLAARMGFRQDPQFAPLINLFPGQQLKDLVVSQRPTKAPVLRLDALGREVDEHGNVINMTKPSILSTLKVNINKQKKEAFQILKPELDVDPESYPHFDPSMGINKTKLLRPKRMSFQFVEEGKWSKDAETIKLKNKFGDAQAKEQKAKLAQLAKAKAAPDVNPNLIEITERAVIKEKPKEQIPEVEWWDVPLLQSGKYGDIVAGVIPEDKLKIDKITIYVEHPRPIEPPAEPALPPPQPLKLTKKEQKKLRTQRRLAREKDRQEMIRQGLLEPPKPKVKISNLMKVLGSEATQDPTRLEKEIRSAAAEREQAHIDRNTARKLTPAERREKKERKLFDDPNALETLVSVYKINDLSHPKIRYKVDINAQENRLSGCAVISDGMSVVAVEGGAKSIKRYAKLMLKRINWSEAVKDENEDEEADEDKPPNKCVLVWQGSVAKPSFNRFFVHECVTEAAARKVFADAGVGHYWDLSINFSDDQF